MIKATIQNGRLEIVAPPEWPDGTQVEIHPVGAISTADDTMSPEEIARTLAAMDLIEPFEMSDAERAAWEADRRERIAREKAEFAEHAKRLRSYWE